MKKLVIVALALFLAVPALSHAGTVVDRNNWDMQIGGYIAGTVQFSDQNDNAMWGAPYSPAPRTAWKENQNDEFGQLSVSPDVRIGFRVLGPDTWGAKSQAYFEFDFANGGGTPGVSTVASGTTVGTNGAVRLRHAYLKYDWAKDTILFGNYSSLYRDPGVGLPPGVATVIAEPVMVAGTRNFQLRWEHKWTKEFATKFAAEYGAQDKWLALGATTTQQDYTRTNLPFLTGMVRYASDACGKVGPLNLAFAAVGTVGERAYMRTATGDRPYSQTHGYGWLTGFHAQVPIIPERNNSKAGGLVFIGQYEVSQNLTVGLSPTSYLAATGATTSGTASANEYSNPRAYIAQGTLNFWLTNEVYTSFIYALNKLDYSDRLENTFTNATANGYGIATRKQLFLIALMYQPNPSLVTGIEYARYVADYQARNTLPKGFQHKGISNAIRFGAYYYF